MATYTATYSGGGSWTISQNYDSDGSAVVLFAIFLIPIIIFIIVPAFLIKLFYEYFPLLEANTTENELTAYFLTGIFLALFIVWAFFYCKKDRYSESVKGRILTVLIVLGNVLALSSLFMLVAFFGEEITNHSALQTMETICTISVLVLLGLMALASLKTKSLAVPIVPLILSGLIVYGQISLASFNFVDILYLAIGAIASLFFAAMSVWRSIGWFRKR